MSKIALTPNANGTGTFTIAAPNSNTNRTLTLPDATGILFSDADVASQAAAEAGTGTGLMTSERVAQAVDAQAGALPTASTGAGQWIQILSATGGAAVLPAGGTWAYAIYRFSSGAAQTFAFSVAAGGTTIGAATSGQVWAGFAWRVQ